MTDTDSKTTARTLGSRWLATAPDWTTPIALTALVLASFGLMSVLGFGRTGVEALIMLVAVIGLYSYSGVTGIPSFGHVGFMAVGGYVATLLTLPVAIKSYRLPGLPTALAPRSWTRTWRW